MSTEGELRGTGGRRAAGIAVLLALAAGPLAAESAPVLRLATTTSVDDTGLLDHLAPRFRSDTGIELEWVAVGSGKALALARNCDADAVLVHDPEAEEQFVRDGAGVDRVRIMHNDFVILGPPGDPAGVRGRPPREAFALLASRQARFASRGDGSGTNRKEQQLWEAAGARLGGKEPWYVQTGQGMLATIVVAEELGAYTLADRGTAIQYASGRRGERTLAVLVEGDPVLLNPYSVIAVNPRACGSVRYDLATRFIQWLVSPSAQALIGAYAPQGQRLFAPEAAGE